MDIYEDQYNAFATSIVISGLGLSGFIWNWPMSYIINPLGVDPKILILDDQFKELYFDETVANNTPTFWLIHALSLTIGTLVIAPYMECIPEHYGIIPKKMFKLYNDMVKPKDNLSFSQSFKDTSPLKNNYTGNRMDFITLQRMSINENIDQELKNLNLPIIPENFPGNESSLDLK